MSNANLDASAAGASGARSAMPPIDRSIDLTVDLTIEVCALNLKGVPR